VPEVRSKMDENVARKKIFALVLNLISEFKNPKKMNVKTSEAYIGGKIEGVVMMAIALNLVDANFDPFLDQTEITPDLNQPETVTDPDAMIAEANIINVLIKNIRELNTRNINSDPGSNQNNLTRYGIMLIKKIALDLGIILPDEVQ
jgi:hypothetical protein